MRSADDHNASIDRLRRNIADLQLGSELMRESKTALFGMEDGNRVDISQSAIMQSEKIIADRQDLINVIEDKRDGY